MTNSNYFTDDDKYLNVTDTETETTTIRDDLKEVHKPFSCNEMLESIKLNKIIDIFTKNQKEIEVFKKKNNEILRKKIFMHYTYLPINVFIYVLFTKDIIIFDSILYYKLKEMFNIKKSSIRKKNDKFCEVIKIPKIYTKTQKLTKFFNGYYYLITYNNDDVFINYNNINYFDILTKFKKFMTFRSTLYTIIVPETFIFNNLYIFNKIMEILQRRKKINYNCNFSVYNDLIYNIMPVKYYNFVEEMITNKYIKQVISIIC